MKKLIIYIALIFLVQEGKAQTLREIISQADDLYYKGQYKEAMDIYEKAYTNKSFPKDTAFAVLLNQMGWAYIDEGAYNKAEPVFIEAKNIREKILGKNHADYAYSCSALSLLYYYKGAYSKAEPLCIEAKNIREKVLGKDNGSYANSCHNLADLYAANHLYTKAELLYIEAKDIREKVFGKDDPDYIKSCNTLANLYADLGMYAKAEPLYIEVKNLNEKAYGKESMGYARACHNLAIIYLDQSLYNKAEPLLVESKNIIEKTSGKNSADYAYSCSGLANLYYDQSLFNKAEPLYIEVKKIQEALGKDHSDYASACGNLAGLYRMQGMYSKAEPLFIEAKNIQEKIVGKNHPDYAFACNNLASLYGAQGLYSAAEPLYMEARNIQEKVFGKYHPSYAMSCNNLGTLNLDQGLYVKAEPFYIEALQVKEKIYGKENPEYASSCNSLANLYTDQGLYSKAEPLYMHAKNVFEKALGKNHIKYATTCNNLANLYFSQGMYNKVEPLYIEARTIQENIFGKYHPAYAMSCNNLASLYYKQGMYSKAEPLYVEARTIQEKIFGKEHPDYAMSCGNLASLYRRLGAYDKSEALYVEAKNIYGKVLGRDHDFYANTCNNLANLYSAHAQYNKAGPLYKEAISNKLKQIDELLPTLSEKERDEFYKSIDYYFKRYYDFALRAKQPSLYAEVFNLQLRIKGLIFQSTQKMQNQIMSSGNPILIQKFADWKGQRKVLNSYMQLSIAERAKKGINTDSLNAVINTLEKSLSAQSEVFASVQSKQKYTWQDVQKKLLPGEAAIEIIRTDSAYIALIVRTETKDNPEAVILTNGKEMEKAFIKYYRSCIVHKIEDERSYKNFWQPIQEKLSNVSKVYVSADGVYHQLNLLTLKNPITKKYLLTETNIQLISNLKDLLTVKNTELARQYEKYKVYLIAYPKYDGGIAENKNAWMNANENLKSDTSQRFYDKGGIISMLPGTKVEAGNIVAICNKLNIQSEAKLLEEASEGYIKSLKNPAILHIATHGFFMPTEESDPNSRSLDNEVNGYKKDPLLNSGLLFASAQQGMSGLTINGEDGVLTAKEAMNLNLDKTELVVMSACETGLGEIRNGEGVYGLQRTFQQAGAKTIIISLWKVSDDATQELMSNFYNNLLSKKMSKRDAFKQAQSDLMQKYPAPYYWGAFVIIGE